MSAERVRGVVRGDVLLVLEDQSATVVRDGCVLRNGTLERRKALEFCADIIAARAAEQLAGVEVGLSASDRVRLQSIAKLLRDQSVCWDMESALLDRLLASPPAPDYRAAITAPTASVIAARDPASLTEDEIRVARTAARADQEELIGVVHSCSDVLRYGDRMGPEVEVASRRRIRDYIASKNTVPTSAITALLDSDMPAGELRKALAEIVGLR